MRINNRLSAASKFISRIKSVGPVFFQLLLLLLMNVTVFAQGKSVWLTDHNSVRTKQDMGQAIKDYHRKLHQLQIDEPIKLSKPIVYVSKTLSHSEIASFERDVISLTFEFFKMNGYKVTNVRAVNPQEHTLTYETVRAMPQNQYFIYSGQSADTVEMTFARKRDQEVDISKLIGFVLKFFGEAGVSITKASAIASEIVDAKFAHSDTVYYKVKLADPNALFRVQVVKKGNDWISPDTYFLQFPSGGSTVFDTIILEYATPNNITNVVYPVINKVDRIGAGSVNNVPFQIVVDKDGDLLRLGIQFTNGSTETVWLERRTNGNKVYWSEDRKFITVYNGIGDVKKAIFLDIYAIQTGENQVAIINNINSNGEKRAITALFYPEYKFKYLN